jgi:hypothetical protein
VTALEERALPATQVAVGAAANAFPLAGTQTQAVVALDPSAANRLFVAAMNEAGPGGLFAAFSADGGASWAASDPADGLLADAADTTLTEAASAPVSAAFDSFGNLFLAYTSRAGGEVVVAVSGDGGQTFQPLHTFAGSPDAVAPHLATGPGAAPGQASVWVAFRSAAGTAVVAGAPVTGAGAVGAFGAAEEVQGSAGAVFPRLAVGPSGGVLVVYERPGSGGAEIVVHRDADGLGTDPFAAGVVAATSQVGAGYPVPAQSFHGISAAPSLAIDAGAGANAGRVYLVYPHAASAGSADTNVFLRASSDQGASWGAAVRVNDDAGPASQFLPSVAVDPLTGNVAVAWYDARGDAGTGAGDSDGEANTDVRLFASVSVDGGAGFVPNVALSPGASNTTRAASAGAFDLGDFTSLAFRRGALFAAWADDSNRTGDNPDGVAAFDVYAAVAQVNTLPELVPGSLSASPASPQTGNTVTVSGAFTDPDVFQGHTVTITWGDGSQPTVVNLPPGTFQFSAQHAFQTAAVFQVQVGVSDGASGAVGGASGTLSVTVTAPPSPPPPPSPPSSTPTPAESYVARLYGDLLGREGEAGGVSYWAGQLGAGVPREQVVRGFLGGAEYRNRTIDRLYAAVLGRAPDDSGRAFALQVLGGLNPLAGLGITSNVLPVLLFSSGEFFNGPGGGTADGFLAALYRIGLGREIDAQAREFFGAQLAAGAPRERVVAAVLNSQEGLTRQIAGYYAEYLGRTPDAGGLAAYLAALDQGARPEDVQAAILASEEYFART